MQCLDSYIDLRAELLRSGDVDREVWARLAASDYERLFSFFGAHLRMLDERLPTVEELQSLAFAIYEALKDVRMLLEHSDLYEVYVPYSSPTE